MAATRSLTSATVGLLLLVAACTGQDSTPEVDAPTSDGTATPGQTWTQAWKTPLRPVSKAVAAGGLAVLYAAEDSNLLLIGLNPASGEVVWRRSATPGLTPPGLAPRVAVVQADDGDVIAFPERVEDVPLQARLVVVDAATGETEHQSEPQFFANWPEACADDEDICVRAKDDGDAATAVEWQRLSVNSGDYSRTVEAPDGSRFLDGDLVDLGSRDPEYVARVQDGAVLWKTLVTAAFPPGSTSDNGWNFSTDPGTGVIYGTIGGPVTRDETQFDRIRSWDLSEGGIAGFDPDDGDVVWKKSGYYDCLNVAADPRDPESVNLPVRCATRGNARGDGDNLKYRNLDITLEGFNPATGATTWTVPLGNPHPIERTLLPFAYASPNEIVASVDVDPAVINLKSGATREPAEGEGFLCSQPSYYEFADAIYYDGTPITRRSGATTLFACDTNRKALPKDSTSGATPTDFGVQIGDVVITREADRVVGYSNHAPH